MTHDERWAQMLKAYRNYILKKHRCPSKYKPEDRQLYNWIKHNRKMRNKGEMPPERQEVFADLRKLADKYRRVNQHAYMHVEGEGTLF